MKFFVHKVKHILIHNGFKTDFFLDRASPVHSLPESSHSSSDHAANSLSNGADISSLADTSARFLRHSSNRPKARTFLILVIYKCCPELDVLWHSCGTTLLRPFRLDSLACRKDFRSPKENEDEEPKPGRVLIKATPLEEPPYASCSH